MAATEHEVVRSELRWAAAVSVFVIIIFGLTLFAALALHRTRRRTSSGSIPKPFI